MTLNELADRIEAADGRNNNGELTLLTSDIARALGWVRVTPSEARNKSGHWVAPEDCRNGRPVYDSLHGTEVHRAPPPWLWSIDAALTLVPEGMDWFRERGAFVPFIVSVDGPTCRYISECDGSLPLALCAAALRARAAQENTP